MRKVCISVLSLIFAAASIVCFDVQPSMAVVSSIALPTVGANGDVLAIAADAEHVYLGGKFSYVGFSAGSGVAVDTSSGRRLPTVTRIKGGTVRAAVSDGKGGWYVGGDFTTVGGTTRSGLARILSNGAAASWGPGVSGRVDSLALSGTTLYVGGSFTSVGGVSRSNAAAVDSSGAVLAWDPQADGSVRTITVHGATAYLGGSFSSAGGAARANLAAVDASTGLATSWNPGADGPVNDLAVAAGSVFAGGEFSAIAGEPRAFLAAVTTEGTISSWNPSADGPVRAVAAKKDGTTLYAGGEFSTIGGAERRNVAALHTSDATATAWDPGADGPVLDVALSRATAVSAAESTVHVVGSFQRAGGAMRYNAAGLDAASAAATGWNPGTDTTTRAVATSGSNIFVGGEFSWINGAPRSHVAALDRATLELDRDWNPVADGPVHAIAVAPGGGAVYIGGDFFTLGGADRKRLGAVVPSSGAVTAWAPRTNNPVNAIAPTSTAVYVGGTFSNINGVARSRIGAVDTASGALDNSFNPGASDTVRFLEVSPDQQKLYVGGRFATIASVSRPGCAELATVSGTATSFAPTAGGDVVSLDLSQDGSTLWCSTASNRTYSYSLGGGPTAPTWTTQTSGDVQAAEDDGGDLYIGGHFSGVKEGSKQHQRLHAASLSTASGLATAWNPTVAGSYGVWEIAVIDGRVLIGGDFDKVGGKDQPRFAAYEQP
jgi:hypothetical protein